MIIVPMIYAEEWAWMEARANPIRDEFSTGICAYDQTGKICAAFVADSFTVDGCGVHLAIDNPMAIRRGFIHECLHFIFVTRGRKRCFGIVPSNNLKAIRFNEHIGFRIVAKLEDAYATGVDYIYMRMDADNNRWVTPEQLQQAA